MNALTSKEWTPATLREMVYSFQKSRTILTAYELELFTKIGDGEKTSTEIASVIGSNRRATDRLLNAITGMGLLEKRDDKFINTAFSKKYLVVGSPDYLGGMGHAEMLWRTWSTLTAAVIAGTSVVERRFHHDDHDPLRSFIAAMHDRGRIAATQIAAQISWNGIHRVLDLGGGSGVYAMAFVHSSENLHATVYDLPVVIPITQEYISKENLSTRIDTMAGDYHHDAIGTNYDLIFLSAVIHSNSLEENKHLIKKCALSLNASGRIIVQDFVMDENRVTPDHGALFALNMLVATNEGDTYTEREITEWLHMAGFKDVVRKETGLGTTQIIGTKSK